MKKQREIKFRIWNKKFKLFSEPPIFLSPNGKQLLYLHTKNAIEIVNIDDDSHILQQFTGLLDKNGKEIYEGDILYCQSITFSSYKLISQINYDKQNACFFVENWENEGDGFSDIEMKVIGNIFENPELLSDK